MLELACEDRPRPAAFVRETVVWSVEDDLLQDASDWPRSFLRWLRSPWRRVPGLSRDRLDSLGERYFEEFLRPRLRGDSAARIRRARERGLSIVLASDGVDHVVRPLARHLGVERIRARRFEFRDGTAIGRVLPDPVEDHVDRTPRAGRANLIDRSELGEGGIPPLEVGRAFAGKNLLLLGASGFLGKVWLGSLLQSLPAVGRIHVLIRRRGARSARQRFEELLESSPVFRVIPRDQTDRIEVVQGDVAAPDLGLDAETRASLASSLDLVVNCAGLTCFNPDLRDALATNVDGVGNLLEFVRTSRKAALLHVSTCFTVGAREGRIREELTPHRTPAGGDRFDPEEERRRLGEVIRSTKDLARGAGSTSVRQRLIEAGLSRAQELGWPNIYTFTKALGEGLLAKRGHDIPVAVVRPSIVESSLAFPFAGWNEGINTSAPLSHLLGTAFRQLPVNQRKRLDVIPVDLACRGMTLVAAALLTRRHHRVYQLATSAANPLDLRRAVELTALAHRRHCDGETGWRSRLLAHLEAFPVSRERYRRFSIPAQLRILRGVNRFLRAASGKAPFAGVERKLSRAKELIDLYEPFLLGAEPVFESDRVEILAAALPPEEKERFGYDPRSFDWYDYWINVHIPALRRWSYPLLEGRPIETRATPRASRRPREARIGVAVPVTAGAPSVEPAPES